MGHVQTNFTASAMKGGGVLASKKDVPAESPKAAPAVEDDSNDVPEGTGAEVLAWVGDDKNRAQRALDAENNDDRPRSSVTNRLKKILEVDE